MKPKAARELAAKVLTQITEHPETHDQGVWWEKGFRGDAYSVRELVELGTCGSTGCVAGWTVALHYEGKKLRAAAMQERLIPERARDLLDLEEDERSWLFNGIRSRDEVTEALQRIVDGKPVLP